jgi:hypothetical protein
MSNVTIHKSNKSGIFVSDSGQVFLDNVKVLRCGESGVCLESNSKVVVSGPRTKVDGNCRKGSSFEYGMDLDKSTTVDIHKPLTKKGMSTNNGRNGKLNWGGSGVVLCL